MRVTVGVTEGRTLRVTVGVRVDVPLRVAPMVAVRVPVTLAVAVARVGVGVELAPRDVVAVDGGVREAVAVAEAVGLPFASGVRLAVPVGPVEAVTDTVGVGVGVSIVAVGDVEVAVALGVAAAVRVRIGDADAFAVTVAVPGVEGLAVALFSLRVAVGVLSGRVVAVAVTVGRGVGETLGSGVFVMLAVAVIVAVGVAGIVATAATTSATEIPPSPL